MSWTTVTESLHHEMFASAVEGACPRCRGRLVIRDLAAWHPDRIESCGWCEPCQRGWSAYTYRTRPGDAAPWQHGERLVTERLPGALA